MPFTHRWLEENTIYSFDISADVTVNDLIGIVRLLNEVLEPVPYTERVHFIFDLRRVWNFILTFQQIREHARPLTPNQGLLILIGSSHVIHFISTFLGATLNSRLRYAHTIDEALALIRDYEP